MNKVVKPENIQVRIRKNQSRASAVGITYWVASIVLFVLSIFPYVGNMTGFEYNGSLWLITCFDPILGLASGAMTGKSLLLAVSSVLYLCLLVFTLCNFIIATTRLFRITKKNPTSKLGYNRATKGVKTMGKAFGRMFFWMLAFTFAVLLLGDGSFTLFFYVAFATALLFHFICNFSACKISYFQATEDRFRPIEKVRTEGRWICVIRNAWQFVSIILIVIFMDKFGVTLGSLFNIIDPKASAGLLDGIVLPAILFLTLVCLIVCIRHATGVTEYNEYGVKGRGMKTCRIFATAIAVLALVGELVVLIVPEGTVVPKWAFLAIFAVAVQWVVAENMFLELSKKKEELEAEEETQQDTKEDKKAKKAKRKEKKLRDKERLARILADDETLLPDETSEETPAETVEETAETTNEAVETIETVEEPVVESETEAESVATETVDEVPDDVVGVIVDEVDGAVTAAEVVGETQEETPEEPKVVLTPEEIAERVALKNKWIQMASMTEVEEEPVTVREEQLVYCPTCNKKLSVKFGTEVAKCPACATMFVLKKLRNEESEFYPVYKTEEDMQAECSQSNEETEDMEAQYLAEAEEELRRLLGSDEE